MQGESLHIFNMPAQWEPKKAPFNLNDDYILPLNDLDELNGLIPSICIFVFCTAVINYCGFVFGTCTRCSHKHNFQACVPFI